jgi:signal transduction histidine kinase/DNA-binding LacI/PurR family transcriptional regulator/ActR/RegA family two-component response regulator
MLLRGLVELHQTQWLGAVDAAREHGAGLITFVGADLEDPHDFRAQANAIYDLATAERLDGLIVWPMGLQVYIGQNRFEAFCRRFEPLPLVSVEAALPGHASVLMDDRGGMAAAVVHLIEVHGHRRIAFVRGPEKHSGAQARYQGYLDALAGHGLPVDRTLVTAPTSFWSRDEAAERVAGVLDDCGRVDAVVGASDGHAIGALAALEARSLRVPEDVGLVGFDDDESAVHYDTVLLEPASPLADPLEQLVRLDATMLPLTTVRAPFYRLAGRAVEVLLALRRGEPVPLVEELPTQLITRASCGCYTPPVAQPEPGMSERNAWAGLTERLRTAFIEAARSPDRGDDFLAALSDAARSSVLAGGTLDDWWAAMLTLRRDSVALLDLRAADHAETLWVRGQRLLGELSERLSRYRYFVGGRREQLVRGAGQRLVTTLEVAELAETLSVELPRLGIASCYLATYDDAARLWARSLLVHEGGRRRTDLEGLGFRSAQLAPPSRLGVGEPANLVALPLHFKERQLGFVMFEVGPHVGWVYQALQEHLAGALHAALLEAQRRDAEVALFSAQHELEARVMERTAQLEMSYDDLTEQLVERERLEAQLRQAQRIEAIGQLAGGIAHDFNNILVVVNGYSDMLMRQLADSDPTREAVEEIRAAGERAAALTAQLLAFSRKQVLQPTVLSLNDVVSNIESLLRRLIGEDQELTSVLAPALAPISVDRSQLEQIIVNLAVNARDAMPSGGRLLIETANVEPGADHVRQTVDAAPGPYVLMRVSDTGVGMDPATQARIFEPFFTTKPRGEGTGLGLATVFGIVRQSGGHVTVASTPGRGTTFEVYLPQSAQHVEAGTSASGSVDQSPAGSETILLVEDDAGVRRAARTFLEEHGYHVLEASRGSEALRLCHEHDAPIDLILTDVVMPEMNGRELVDRLAQICPETPVLYMSGHTDSETVRLKAGEGMIHLLQKPFTSVTLARMVRQMLDRSPSE